MSYRVPHEKLSIEWMKEAGNPVDSFTLSLPWASMEIDVDDADKVWIQNATSHLHTNPQNSNVQRFIKELNDYPVSYVYPRKLEEFEGKDLQECLDITVDASTPSSLLATFGCPIDSSLEEDIIDAWTWDHEKILSKARIEGTDLYDPVSFVSYLICYRLEWESGAWTGQDGLGKFMESLLVRDEGQFFQVIGWIARQSWYVTSESGLSMEPALTHFPKAKERIAHFIADEAGHYKFMEQVFHELNLNKDDFPVGEGTKWLLASRKRAAIISPLAFSAMVSLFEAPYYEKEDSIARIISLSSKPNARRGFDLHHKINQEHRHCDVPVYFASCVAPQTRSHALLTLGLFELTLNILDRMEQRLVKKIGIC
jgi:hypothetical protein